MSERTKKVVWWCLLVLAVLLVLIASGSAILGYFGIAALVGVTGLVLLNVVSVWGPDEYDEPNYHTLW